MYRIDLNCDIGEGFGIYSFGQDKELLGLITSANIACGFHAGDPNQMFNTVKMCLEHDVAIGAHPGYPDLPGFGRRSMEFDYDEIRNMILYQAGALAAIAGSLGGKVEHIKPHGELYNTALRNDGVAAAVVDAVAGLKGPALVMMAGSKIVEMAQKRGVKVIHEGFADRNYGSDRTLLSRKFADAVINDPERAASRVIRMIKENRVDCCNGSDMPLYADTICVHSDNKNAVNILKQIRKELDRNNVQLLKPSHEL